MTFIKLKLKFWRLVTLACFLLLVLSTLYGCGQSKNSTTKQRPITEPTAMEVKKLYSPHEISKVKVYFLLPGKNILIPVTLPTNPTRERDKIAVEKLLAGPVDSNLESAIPENTRLRNLYAQGDTVFVDVTGDILTIKSDQAAQAAINAIVLTLTEDPQVKQVQLIVNGKTESKLANIPIDKPFSRPLINEVPGQKNKGTNVTVYFTDPNAMFLVPLSMKIGDGTQQLKEVIDILLAGPPADTGLAKTIWPGTKLLNATLENGVAKIDLSKEAVAYGGGHTMEQFFVNSLLYSLTEIPGVDSVQLMIEGKRDILPEGTDISKPLVRDPYINPFF